ncbi:MAG: hypothetical protein IKI94_07195 [Ruminococcus sp.]|nr:hypothetical protein [Ruminococcus sp.]
MVMKFLTVLQAQEQLTGLDEAPKDMYVKIGISERGKVGTQSWLHSEEALSRKFSDIT